MITEREQDEMDREHTRHIATQVSDAILDWVELRKGLSTAIDEAVEAGAPYYDESGRPATSQVVKVQEVTRRMMDAEAALLDVLEYDLGVTDADLRWQIVVAMSQRIGQRRPVA